MQTRKLVNFLIVASVIVSIILSVSPVYADPAGVTVTAGPKSGANRAMSPLPATPIASYPQGSTIIWPTGIYSPVALSNWDVSCVSEAVWPARNQGLSLVSTEGYGGSLEAGETQTQTFYFKANKVGQYDIACYFWVNDVSFARIAWLIEVTR